jgi:hypothetical protein
MMFGAVYTLLTGRHRDWPKERKKHLAKQPCCQVCSTLKDVEVHHKIPFHIDPFRELDPDNMITLCRVHHLWWGHLGDWHSWNVTVCEDAITWAFKIASRPHNLTKAPYEIILSWGDVMFVLAIAAAMAIILALKYL